jgi:hypothetical protein
MRATGLRKGFSPIARLDPLPPRFLIRTHDLCDPSRAAAPARRRPPAGLLVPGAKLAQAGYRVTRLSDLARERWWRSPQRIPASHLKPRSELVTEFWNPQPVPNDRSGFGLRAALPTYGAQLRIISLSVSIIGLP